MLKKMLFIGLALVPCLAILVLVIDRYPLIDMVISTKREYNQEKTPGLYVIPDVEHLLPSTSCITVDESRKLDIGRLIFMLPEANLVEIKNLSKKDYSPVYRVTYNDRKILMVIPGVPEIDALVAENKKNGSSEYDWFMKRNSISTREDLVTYILSNSPNQLSIFDDPLTIISKTIALSFKYSMVPIDAARGYKLNNENIRGLQIGNNEVMFVHLFDDDSNHYQLRFHFFDSQDIECILNDIVVQSPKVLPLSNPRRVEP